MVADLDYKGIKSKVKSALWTCDVSGGICLREKGFDTACFPD